MNANNLIEVEHFYPHPPSAVWLALTDPDLLARWWARGNIRAIVGHRFDLEMGQWGKQPCEIVAAQPERLLRFRFASDTLDTLISWELIPEHNGTRLRLTQEGFNLESPLGRAALEGMKPGWPKALERLGSLLSA